MPLALTAGRPARAAAGSKSATVPLGTKSLYEFFPFRATTRLLGILLGDPHLRPKSRTKSLSYEFFPFRATTRLLDILLGDPHLRPKSPASVHLPSKR